MKNYTFDFGSKTLTITKEFAENAIDPTSNEYAIMTRFQHDFPDMRISRKTHRSPKKANSAKGLTYAHMERYIKVYENASELLEVFQKIKELAASQTNGYLYVKNWFVQQFPSYKEIPAFKNGKLYVLPIPAPDTEKHDFKQAEVA
ncbi:MAG: hypothetical protein PHY23_03740 [Oscillospiraceae bacterium]|jgi:hypothetical protein|nr:hypothetical protein [Oscillospiraceae bacterium]